MPLRVAETLIVLLQGCVVLGLLFAVLFVSVGVHRIDPLARSAPWSFRVLTLRPWLGRAPLPPASTSTALTVRGEIVDSKCYLGVMNPGEGTAHRDCVVRCLSGGIPAMFAFRDQTGGQHLALLLLEHGRRPPEDWRDHDALAVTAP